MPTHAFSVRVDGQTISGTGSFTVAPAQTSPYKVFPGSLNPDGTLTKCRIGMRTPDAERDARRAEVQAAPATKQLRAWRIFVSPGDWSSPSVEGDIIDWAIARNMLPVITYKGVASTTLANQTADYLNSKGVPIAVGWHHEPRGDMTPAAWLAQQAVYSPIFQARPNLSYGCIINGYLVSTANGRDELATWLPTDKAGLFQWTGGDFYQAAPDSIPSTTTPWPGERMRQFADWLDTRGYADQRLLCGEFNGNHGTVITDACNALLESDRWWAGMLFNSTTGNKGIVVTHNDGSGDRLGAFQAGMSSQLAYQ